MAPLISVIVPNRDGEEVIGACLEALARQRRAPDQTIVVDDGSVDRSAALVAERFPWVHLVSAKRSGGFAGACALGLAAAGGDWIAVLNNDAVADPGWLEAGLEAGESGPAVGSVACRVVLAAPGDSIDSLGLRVEKNGLARLRGRGRKEAELEALAPAPEVFGPAGAAALYRRTAIAEVGFFPPDFENYYEDVDLAWRLRWAGWSCVLAGAARVVHRHSYTMSRVGADKRRMLQRNRLRTIIRNWPAAWLARFGPLVGLYDLGSIALAVGEGSPIAAIRARRDVLGGLARDLAARKKVLTSAKVSADDMRKWLE